MPAQIDFVSQILPLLELGLNTALMLTGVPGGAALAASLEATINPLIASIKSGTASPAQNVLAGYAATIGVLNALKNVPGIDAAVLAKAAEYILAAQDATTAYLKAMQGYDGSTLVPVQPIT